VRRQLCIAKEELAETKTESGRRFIELRPAATNRLRLRKLRCQNLAFVGVLRADARENKLGDNRHRAKTEVNAKRGAIGLSGAGWMPSVQGTSMKQLNPSVVVYFVGVLAVGCQDANAQMQMRQPMPVTPQIMIPREFPTEEQWINSIVDRWSMSQRKSWRLLDRRFSGWASHLVWLRKTAGRPSGEVTVQTPRLPLGCRVDSFVVPSQSVAESMSHFREVLPDLNWNAWANIEPTFRAIAEWEMSAEHFRAQVSKALKDWWALNDETVQACLNATVLGEGEAHPAIAAASKSIANPRYSQIDRRARSEHTAIDRMVAPEAIKKEALEQVSDAAAVDRYAANVVEHTP
jgi:hypothetical protein